MCRNQSKERPVSGGEFWLRAVEDYATLLEDPEVDTIYIATPHPMHPRWAIRAASCCKHILREKPLALNHSDASATTLAAAEHGGFLMEAFMYRCHPQTARATEFIRSGALGSIRHVRASFGFAATFSAESRLFSHELGAGGILDIGCYPVSFARLLTGLVGNSGSLKSRPRTVGKRS